MTGGPMEGFVSAFSGLIGEDVSEERKQLYRLAEAVRALTAAMIDKELPADVVENLLAAFSGIEGAVADAPRRVYEDRAAMARGFIDFSPVAGEANPVAPPVRLRVEGDVVLGEARFEQSHEGPPGFVHGGVLSAAFDELLGLTQSLSGSPGMTGRLTVNYRRPTPLRTTIYFEGRVQEINGRKILTKGTSAIDVDGVRTVTAESEGLFISLPPERFAQMAMESGAVPRGTVIPGLEAPASEPSLASNTSKDGQN
jgi:acyl-coenzyme A thioesterase PaaI-like protein